jgi:hypothetical protein
MRVKQLGADAERIASSASFSADSWSGAAASLSSIAGM